MHVHFYCSSSCVTLVYSLLFNFISLFLTDLDCEGTQKYKEEYTNPAQLGSHNKNFVFSEMSSYGADFCSPYKFICHTHTKLIGANFTKAENNSWMAIDLGMNTLFMAIRKNE